MPNEYSVQIHDFITDKIEAARKQIGHADETKDLIRKSYWQGQLDEFYWLRSYLKEHIDLNNFIYYQ